MLRGARGVRGPQGTGSPEPAAHPQESHVSRPPLIPLTTELPRPSGPGPLLALDRAPDTSPPSLQFLQWVKRTSLPSTAGHFAGAPTLISPNRDCKGIMGFNHWNL